LCIPLAYCVLNVFKGAPGGALRGPFVERAPTLQFNFHMFGVEIPEIEDPADAWEGMREASIKTAVEIFHFKKVNSKNYCLFFS